MLEAPPLSAGYTPPKLAERYGVDPEKVILWIGSGELGAINIATKTSSRPRWLILPEHIAAFERARAALPPPPKPERRRRTKQTERRFF